MRLELILDFALALVLVLVLAGLILAGKDEELVGALVGAAGYVFGRGLGLAQQRRQ